jgi:hypothetical protein
MDKKSNRAKARIVSTMDQLTAMGKDYAQKVDAMDINRKLSEVDWNDSHIQGIADAFASIQKISKMGKDVQISKVDELIKFGGELLPPEMLFQITFMLVAVIGEHYSEIPPEVKRILGMEV